MIRYNIRHRALRRCVCGPRKDPLVSGPWSWSLVLVPGPWILGSLVPGSLVRVVGKLSLGAARRVYRIGPPPYFFIICWDIVFEAILVRFGTDFGKILEGFLEGFWKLF